MSHFHKIIGDGEVGVAFATDGDPKHPPITFSHSLAASSSMWAPQVEAFANRFYIIRVDVRGHGRSDVPPGPYRFETLASDIVAVWDALGIARSTFVGLSLGGIIGASLGLRHVSRLNKLVLADCRFDATPAYIENWRQRKAALEKGGMEAVADVTMPTWLTESRRSSDPALVEELRNGIIATNPVGWLGIVNALPSLDYKRQLKELALRTLVICGSQDAVRDEMKDCAALLPDGRFAEIPNAAHVSNRDQPQLFNETLMSFVGVG